MVEILTVGPAKYTRGGTISFGSYANRETAILIMANDGSREAVATVALEGAPTAHSRNGVWLKGWSANEGLPKALEIAGVCTLTDEKFKTGFAHAQFALLSDEALASLAAWKKKVEP